MEMFQVFNSELLISLYKEVSQLNLAEPILIKRVKNLSKTCNRLAETVREEKRKRLLLKVRADINKVEPQLELDLALALLHIKRNRTGFPEIIRMPFLAAQDMGTVVAIAVETLVEHTVVIPELKARGVNVENYAQEWLNKMTELSGNDPADEVKNAFAIADFMLSFTPTAGTIEQLTNRYPRSVVLAERMAAIVQLYDIHSPYDTRRCYMKLINFVDEYLHMSPPLHTLIGIDLVLSPEQLANQAQNIYYRDFYINAKNLVQLVFQANPYSPGFFFALFEESTNHSLKRNLEYDLKNGSLKDFLDHYEIKYLLK